jgi:hypothetical protein
MQPFDLLIIVQNNDVAHIGLAVTREICNDSRLTQSIVYMLDSSLRTGVQLRDLSWSHGDIYYAPMKASWRAAYVHSDSDAILHYTNVIQGLVGREFTTSPACLVSILLPCLRPLVSKITGDEPWLFSCELVVHVLKKCDILYPSISEYCVRRSDLLPPAESEMPKIYETPVFFETH